MSFSIGPYNTRTLYDFKSRLSGGGARGSLFECVLSFPDVVLKEAGDEADLYVDTRFLIKTASLPASNLTPITVPFRGRTLKLAGDRTFEPWTVTVINDTNFRIRNAFEIWSNYMNRHDDNSGVIDPKVYQRNILVHQLSRGSVTAGETKQPVGADSINIVKSYQLLGAFPTNISPIELGYEQSDSIEEFSVTFEYQWWDTYRDNESTSMLGTSENGSNVPGTVTDTTAKF